MKDENEAHDTDLDTDTQITLMRVSVLEICVGHTGNHHFQVRHRDAEKNNKKISVPLLASQSVVKYCVSFLQLRNW